jgi:hypothetical protein
MSSSTDRQGDCQQCLGDPDRSAGSAPPVSGSGLSTQINLPAALHDSRRPLHEQSDPREDL